jgi:hypothetical protein
MEARVEEIRNEYETENAHNEDGDQYPKKGPLLTTSHFSSLTYILAISNVKILNPNIDILKKILILNLRNSLVFKKFPQRTPVWDGGMSFRVETSYWFFQMASRVLRRLVYSLRFKVVTIWETKF